MYYVILFPSSAKMHENSESKKGYFADNVVCYIQKEKSKSGWRKMDAISISCRNSKKMESLGT